MATSLFSPVAAAASPVTARPSNSAVALRAAYLPLPSPPTTHHFPSPQKPHFPGLPKPLSSPRTPLLSAISTKASAATDSSSSPPPVFHGSCYVLGENIDTDQIIPAEHLTLVPSKPDEYRKLGSLALIGLPSSLYLVPFVDPGKDSTRYPVIIAGANFGCGSSREHAPVALGASGVRVVVAESYARIFFRNSVATGEVYPVELEQAGAWKECSIGDDVVIDLGENVMINRTTGKEYRLKPIGDAGPVIEAGGIFAYARKTGMIAA